MKTDTLKSSLYGSPIQIPTHENAPAEEPSRPGHSQAEEEQQQHTASLDGHRGSAPDPQEIERAAYELYAASGYTEGHSLDHWLEAERVLSSGPLTRVA
jgi:hypothetical protein